MKIVRHCSACATILAIALLPVRFEIEPQMTGFAASIVPALACAQFASEHDERATWNGCVEVECDPADPENPYLCCHDDDIG